MELIKRYFKPEIRNINEEERSVEFVISSEAVDTYGTVFKVDGAVTERYEQNPVFTYQHEDWSSDPDMVLGISEVRKEGKEWIAKAFFEDLDNDLNEVAEKVWRKVKKGTLRMASIFARPLEGTYGVRDLGEDPDVFYFRKWELFGWSVVVHGSNPDALKRSTGETEFIKRNTPEKEENTHRASMHDYDARLIQLSN